MFDESYCVITELAKISAIVIVATVMKDILEVIARWKSTNAIRPPVRMEPRVKILWAVTVASALLASKGRTAN